VLKVLTNFVDAFKEFELHNVEGRLLYSIGDMRYIDSPSCTSSHGRVSTDKRRTGNYLLVTVHMYLSNSLDKYA
jgi:hypothetical protein